MIPVEISVGGGHSNEREALRPMVTNNVTDIADRGYSRFRLFNDILQVQAHLIFRVKDNLIIGDIIESLRVSLPASVQLLFSNVTDQLIRYKSDPYQNIYRPVCFRVGKERYHILTDRQDLSTFQIIVLYLTFPTPNSICFAIYLIYYHVLSSFRIYEHFRAHP